MQCKRESCGCEVSGNQMEGYCSEECRAGTTEAGGCGCGHPECG